MIFNLIHRAADTDTYHFQRKCAHELGLKATVMIPTKVLEDERIISIAKQDNEEFGDELGIWIMPLKHHPSTMVWLLNDEQKMETVKFSIDKYRELFGRNPKVVGNYVLDSHLMKMIKDYCPDVTATVAGCFEEGVKVFHGCNNSWYLFSEGMSWNPWYPSKTQSVRPAENEEDWAGVVAVPHLSRDLVFAYESRNDFFASHPANVQRGLANDGLTHDYDYNLADQYRMQEDYNDGFSYYQIHVSSGWLHHNHNIIDSDEITQTLYRETLEYMVELRKNGELQDMHVSEFAEAYKSSVPIGKSDIGIGKDILFGSGKHYFWIFNPDYRVLVDTFQGGSIGDLRPYAGKYESFTGTDSPSLTMNSYPYIIHSQYRSGIKNHYSDGARTTLMVKHGDEVLDMCNYRTRIQNVERGADAVTLTLTPANLKFADGLEVEIQTVYTFVKGGRIEISRNINSASDADAVLEMTEYIKGCYGFTEYPENMKGIEFYFDGKKVGDYEYASRTLSSDTANKVSVAIPQITTEAVLEAVNMEPDSVSVMDGHLFVPYYTMKVKYTVPSNVKEVKSCLTIKRTKE